VHPYGIERAGLVPEAAPVVFVEGAVDVLALRRVLASRGEIALVLGVPGLGGWRPAWAELARGRVAAVAVDSDAHGEAHVMQIAHDLAYAGATRIERWTPPGSKDWAESLTTRVPS
jgi:hypothetical protein